MAKVINEFQGEYRWLSNFWRYDGRLTVEHAYQAAKAKDLTDRDWILTSKTPGDAKRRAKQIKIRPDFDTIKEDVMERLLRVKFRHPEMRRKLLETGDAILIEGNRWHDNFWGTCFCNKCGNRGQNRLGKMIMKIRQEIT